MVNLKELFLYFNRSGISNTVANIISKEFEKLNKLGSLELDLKHNPFNIDGAQPLIEGLSKMKMNSIEVSLSEEGISAEDWKSLKDTAN